MIHSCLSSLINTSDLSNLLRPKILTRLSFGVTCLLSSEEGEVLKLKGSKAKRAKPLVEGPNPRVHHLALPPELGSKDRRANP